MPTKKTEEIPVEFDVGTATLEALGEHRTALIEELKALRPESKEALAAMSDEEREALKAKREEINGKIQAVEAEKTDRADREAAAEAELAEFDQAVAALEPVEEEVAEEEEEPEEAEATVTPIKTEKKPVESTQTVPLAASVAKPAKALTAGIQVPSPKDVKPPASAKVIPLKPQLAITAAAGSGYDMGAAITNDQLGEAMTAALGAAFESSHAPRVVVASMHGDFPQERILSRSDVEGNSEKLDAVATQMMTMDGLQQALTAAICAPGTPDYRFRNISTDERPLFNGLPAFGTDANRGRVIYQQPVGIGDVTGAFTTLTDLAGTPTPSSKNVLTVTCGTDVTATIEAFAVRLKIDNFNRMTFAERWDHFWDVTRSGLARLRESRALQIIDDSASTRSATQLSTQLGAARDLFRAWSVAATAHRNRERMAPDAPITVVAPAWARQAIVDDIMMAHPGDDAMARGLGYVQEMANARNLNMIWHLDTPAGSGQTNQLFGLQTDGAVLQDWIADVVSYIFPPSTWFSLSGPTIDLGTDIRDSTLNALNQVEGFVEYFETIAFRGLPGASLRLSNKICVSGSSSAAKAFICPVGS